MFPGKNVIVIGASFIGMEAASFLASKNTASSISVVCGKRSCVSQSILKFATNSNYFTVKSSWSACNR